MKSRLLFLACALLLGGCAAATSEPLGCDGAPWDDVRRGIVACEVPHASCAYSREGEPMELSSTEPGWVCDCGGPPRYFWCRAR